MRPLPRRFRPVQQVFLRRRSASPPPEFERKLREIFRTPVCTYHESFARSRRHISSLCQRRSLRSRSLPPYCCSFVEHGLDGSARCGGHCRKEVATSTAAVSKTQPLPVNGAPAGAGDDVPLTVRQAATYLGVRIQTVYLWVELKQIPRLRVMGRNIRFLKSDLDPFRASFKQEVGIGKTE